MTADTIGGVWTYALDLAAALAPHRVEIALATMGAPLRAEQWAAARATPNLRVFESAYALEWMREPWADVDAAGEWLLELERQVQPDLVHLNNYAHGDLPWRAPVMMVAHSCVLSWWRAVKGQDAPAEWDTYRRRVAAGLAAAELVAAPTASMLAALERCHGVAVDGRVIYNGSVPARFVPAAKEPLVLSAGRLWDEAKNLATLAACAPDVPWPIYVAGPTSHPDGGDVEAAGVHQLGRLAPAELATWMSRAAIYALPARYEPFGLSALEAALSGCALVLGDIDSLREVWGDAARFVAPDDPPALAAALAELAEDASARAELAHRSRARAQRYTLARQGAAYRDLYRELEARPELARAEGA